MEHYQSYGANNCRLHPDRPGALHCQGCGESYCKQCLDRSGDCPTCSKAAERFLDGFSTALTRWEENLRTSPVETTEYPVVPGKKRKLSRNLGMILLAVLFGAYCFYVMSNYNLMLGQRFFEQGNLSKSQFYFEKAALKDPENAELKFILGNIYFQEGTLDEAVAVYRLCLELDSLHSGAMNNLAWIYSQLEFNLDKASSLSKRSLDIDPNNPAYLDTAAEIYYLKKDYFRALTFLRKALDQNPPNIDYYKKKFEKIKKLTYGQRRFLEV